MQKQRWYNIFWSKHPSIIPYSIFPLRSYAIICGKIWRSHRDYYEYYYYLPIAVYVEAAPQILEKNMNQFVPPFFSFWIREKVEKQIVLFDSFIICYTIISKFVIIVVRILIAIVYLTQRPERKRTEARADKSFHSRFK